MNAFDLSSNSTSNIRIVLQKQIFSHLIKMSFSMGVELSAPKRSSLNLSIDSLSRGSSNRKPVFRTSFTPEIQSNKTIKE